MNVLSVPTLSSQLFEYINSKGYTAVQMEHIFNGTKNPNAIYAIIEPNENNTEFIKAEQSDYGVCEYTFTEFNSENTATNQTIKNYMLKEVL